LRHTPIVLGALPIGRAAAAGVPASLQCPVTGSMAERRFSSRLMAPELFGKLRAEQIARSRRLMLFRPHRPLRCSHGITSASPAEAGKTQSQGSAAANPETLQPQIRQTAKTVPGQRLRNCSQTAL